MKKTKAYFKHTYENTKSELNTKQLCVVKMPNANHFCIYVKKNKRFTRFKLYVKSFCIIERNF